MTNDSLSTQNKVTSHRAAVMRWQNKHKAHIYAWRRKAGVKSVGYMHNRRFSGQREAILKRDNYQCVECGITRQEHRARYGRDLTVYHLNGDSRHTATPDNSEQNLITLCLPHQGRMSMRGGD